jgi:hypothetical protein
MPVDIDDQSVPSRLDHWLLVQERVVEVRHCVFTGVLDNRVRLINQNARERTWLEAILSILWSAGLKAVTHLVYRQSEMLLVFFQVEFVELGALLRVLCSRDSKTFSTGSANGSLSVMSQVLFERNEEDTVILVRAA